jgi:hypothetical protein
LLNIEEDEAGRLKRFRRRFGRGYDAESMSEGEEVSENDELFYSCTGIIIADCWMQRLGTLKTRGCQKILSWI